MDLVKDKWIRFYIGIAIVLTAVGGLLRLPSMISGAINPALGGL